MATNIAATLLEATAIQTKCAVGSVPERGRISTAATARTPVMQAYILTNIGRTGASGHRMRPAPHFKMRVHKAREGKGAPRKALGRFSGAGCALSEQAHRGRCPHVI